MTNKIFHPTLRKLDAGSTPISWQSSKQKRCRALMVTISSSQQVSSSERQTRLSESLAKSILLSKRWITSQMSNCRLMLRPSTMKKWSASLELLTSLANLTLSTANILSSLWLKIQVLSRLKGGTLEPLMYGSKRDSRKPIINVWMTTISPIVRSLLSSHLQMRRKRTRFSLLPSWLQL